MSDKKPASPPKWIKNTYFWIAGLLFFVALYGLFKGENTIRDPGQKRESGLVWMYFISAIISLINGYISHLRTVRDYNEENTGA